MRNDIADFPPAFLCVEALNVFFSRRCLSPKLLLCLCRTLLCRSLSWIGMLKTQRCCLRGVLFSLRCLSLKLPLCSCRTLLCRFFSWFGLVKPQDCCLRSLLVLVSSGFASQKQRCFLLHLGPLLNYDIVPACSL